MGSSTFVSRILGFVRDVVIANFLGSTFQADAFFVAFRIPNLLRRLFGEGSLTASFIPVFTSYHVKKGKKEADKIASISFTYLIIVLLIITFLGIYFSPAIIKIIAPGFEKDIKKFLLTVKLNKIMFSYIFYISLVALSMGILNSLKHFFAPSIAPAFLNIAMILSVLIAYIFKKNIILALAYGVILGGVLQLILQLFYLKKLNIKLYPCFQFNPPAIKEILLLMGPSILGLAITQINIFIGTLLASFLPTGSISYLYYADRLIQFPLGIFAVSVGSAVLPLLSEQYAQKKFSDMEDSFIFGIKLIFLITIPATIGLIFGGKPIISFLFQRGKFDLIALNKTYLAIVGYAIGLWAYAGIRVIVPTFYAFKDTKTPVKASFISLIANIIFSIILMKYLLHMGLAIATAIASMINFTLLLFYLKKYLKINVAELSNFLLKIILPAFSITVFLIFFQKFFPYDYYANFFIKFSYILIMVFLSIIIYITVCYIMGIKEAKMLLKKII
jgi:putative peptidoglycan lipid II flippase